MAERDWITELLESVAQEIVYCNCATEGKALKRCEHEGLATDLERKLRPLLEAGEELRKLYPYKPMVTSAIDWDAAKKEALGGSGAAKGDT